MNTSSDKLSIKSSSSVNTNKRIGLGEHLRIIAENLYNISNNEKNRYLKKKHFTTISQLLNKDADRVEKMLQLIEDNEEEEADITVKVEEEFFKSTNFFIDAVDCLFEFIETEDNSLIQEALDIINEGEKSLEQAKKILIEVSSPSKNILG